MWLKLEFGSNWFRSDGDWFFWSVCPITRFWIDVYLFDTFIVILFEWIFWCYSCVNSKCFSRSLDSFCKKNTGIFLLEWRKWPIHSHIYKSLCWICGHGVKRVYFEIVYFHFDFRKVECLGWTNAAFFTNSQNRSKLSIVQNFDWLRFRLGVLKFYNICFHFPFSIIKLNVRSWVKVVFLDQKH